MLKQSVYNLAGFIELRQINLDLWASQPIVDVFYSNPELAVISTPGLHTFFSRIKTNKNWVENILLTDNGEISYDLSNKFKGLQASNSDAMLKQLLNDPDLTCFAFDLPISSVSRQTLIFIKRPFVKNGRPVPGKYLAVSINPEKLQSILFKDAKVGENGFVALLVKSNQQIWTPSLVGDEIEVQNFIEASRNWQKWSDIPASYQSIDLEAHPFSGYPLAVVAVASKNEIRKPVYFLILTSISAGAVVLLIGIGVTFVLSKRTAQPLVDLAENVKQIEMDNLEQFKSNPVQSFYTEVKILNQAFTSMIEKLIFSRKELQEKNAALMALGKSLRVERNRLYTTLSCIGDGVITTDKEAAVTFMNPVAERILGCGMEAVINKPLDEAFTIINEHTRIKIENPVAEVIKSGKVVGLANHTVLINKKGKEIPINDSGAPIQDDEGNLYGVVLVFRDVTKQRNEERELRESRERLSVSLQEKEVLLREIHHRVKNNMQVISSLLSLQTNQLQDDALRDILRDVTHRVRSMALVHEKLYQSTDLAHIEFADYARSLLNYIRHAHETTETSLELELDLEPVALPVNTAVPCGLILNELFSNALKHAFAGRDNGRVTVSLRSEAQGRVRLGVGDNGIGLPDSLDWRQSPTLGLHIVQMLAEQLNADVQVVSAGGTEFMITFERSRT